MKIGILGAGNMGTALGRLLGRNGHEVVLWDHFAAVVKEIRTESRNSRYLPGVPLPETMTATSDAEECVRGAELVVVAVPSPFVRGVLQAAGRGIGREAIFLTASKGIDPETRRPIFGTVGTLLPDHPQCILAGPAIANEFARDEATRVLVASAHLHAAKAVAGWLSGDRFKAEVSTDATGAVLGGIMKNVYALLLGFVETSIGAGRNFKAALMTAAVAEMADLGAAFGGDRETLYGLAGLGDLVATSLSENSHNRKCGQLLGAGRTLPEVEAEMGVLPEGVRTAAIISTWAAEQDLVLPLAEKAACIVTGKTPDWTDF